MIGNQQTMKEINRSAILHLISSKGPISRVELSRITKLSPTTVSVLVEEAIQSGLVQEMGVVGSGVGRKMTLLQIDASSGFVMGVDLSQYRCVLLNLNGDIIASSHMKRMIGQKEIIENLLIEIQSFIENQGLELELIKWMGVSVPGVIDDKEETVLLSKVLDLYEFNIKRYLIDYVPCPIHIVNDLDAASFAERYSGAAKGKETIIYIMLHYGIGAGIVINNQIYRGVSGQAGRITDFFYYSTDQMSQRLQQQDSERFAGLSPDETLDKFILLAQQGVSPHVEEYENLIDGIADYCRLVLQFINPEQMILSGWITRNEQFFNELRERINDYEKAIIQETPIAAAYWKEDGSAIGAATLGLHNIFKMRTVG
ncbi:ROK family transcriptional regulator [Alkalihalobacillus hemicellulosilyticus]|uniref:Xylose-responsive transcription regulator n=1 Tax=Halalkalibacter hemicellulosilyticusJCM 9152 TaxID=1236971 RepID=W4QMG3_9BACI|nr:ROK family transcriptional regulator [Halalkalibacter hemicellulosilyticus]GAE32519.1 xylose-responsive transcription regulator [Halalkalibacter hemicellulosilyticusJCM 9152]